MKVVLSDPNHNRSYKTYNVVMINAQVYFDRLKLKSIPLRYVIVGFLVVTIDVILFNLLTMQRINAEPVSSKIVSGSLATILAFYLHREWTFNSRDYDRATSQQALIFGIVQAVGIVIASTCIWVSHYVLDFTSATANNISGNLIGLLLATAFRYYFNSKYVYR